MAKIDELAVAVTYRLLEARVLVVHGAQGERRARDGHVVEVDPEHVIAYARVPVRMSEREQNCTPVIIRLRI